MDDPVAVPMALTGAGQKHHASAATLALIAQEYWTKTLHDWEYLEYLALEMTVVAEELPATDAGAMGASAFSYGNDRAAAKRLWP